MSPTYIVAYLALFASVGFVFLFVNLLVGRFLRPNSPNEEKLAIYECGEPTIGSSFVQFDLRFYVVALLFIIFDVEIAFFFPWATVFGKATHLMDPNFTKVESVEVVGQVGVRRPVLTPQARQVLSELGVPDPSVALPEGDSYANQHSLEQTSASLARMSIYDIGVFFSVLMVGFAYVWRRGDLDWVRAVSKARSHGPTISDDRTLPRLEMGEPALAR